MVTQHGKNLAAGLSKTQHGRYLMSKMFNVKQESISLQLPQQHQRDALQLPDVLQLPDALQLPRPPQQLPRLRLTLIHIAYVN